MVTNFLTNVNFKCKFNFRFRILLRHYCKRSKKRGKRRKSVGKRILPLAAYLCSYVSLREMQLCYNCCLYFIESLYEQDLWSSR